MTGKFIRKIELQTEAGHSRGLAISPDGVHVVVSHDDNTLSVYTLPSGEHIRTFGRGGEGKGQFVFPAKLCFSVTGNILVAECYHMRVQEVTLTGEHVRRIGVGGSPDKIEGIAANSEVIVVGKCNCTSDDRIMMFDAVTGALVRAFGDYGNSLGRLMKHCRGIRFTPDYHHIIVAESKGDGKGGRLSVFTLAGKFTRSLGSANLIRVGDVDFADNGDIIACDSATGRIYVNSADGSTLLRQWGGFGPRNGKFMDPPALAMCGGQLYVLDGYTKRVQVFE